MVAAAAASTSALPIVVGPSFQRGVSKARDGGLISVKYNFRPPSFAAQGPSKSGLLHCPKRQESEWLLEYAGDSPLSSSNEGQGGAESSHAYIGIQSQAKEVDCILTWDEDRQAYVLERLSSCFSMRYERKATRLSVEAKRALPSRDAIKQKEDVPMADPADSPSNEEGELGDDDDEDLAAQLQKDLDAQSNQSAEEDGLRDEDTGMTKSGSQTGLGLINAAGSHEEVITPRGSPYIDRSARYLAGRGNDFTNSVQMRSTPAMSPVSVANSPRPIGLESSLSSTWRPPTQRANVALTFDDEDEEEEEEDDSDEEEDDEEDDDEGGARNTVDDDDDLDAFARELEGSLMEPSSAAAVVEEPRPAASTITRARRASNRIRKQ